MPIKLVLGLGFGDEGKGSIVDWLARRCASPPVVVRWNGGPQAAHHVVTEDRRLHCFAQLGSGSFVDGARTHLGPEMAVDLYALHGEAAALDAAGVPDVLSRLSIDPRAVLVTPWHAIVNQVREALRGAGRHGTTGRGIFEAKLGRTRVTAGALLEPDFADRIARLRGELAATARALVDAHADPPPAARELAGRAEDRDLADAFFEAARAVEPAGVTITLDVPTADDVIFEGAQGALLDRDHGFFPHVTPSWVTREAAELAAREMRLAGPLECWGVLRAFHTRHGAGPFPSEEPALRGVLPEPHNPEGAAGIMRVGWFDAVLARWALDFAGPVDRLVVTCLDRALRIARPMLVESWNAGAIAELTAIPPAARTALATTAMPDLRPIDGDYLAALEHALGRRVDAVSYGMSARDKRER
jgi:adenylosuccinate synthase